MNLFSKFCQKYKNTEVIEFSSVNCKSAHSFSNREKKSTAINTVSCLTCAAQSTVVLSAGGLQGETNEKQVMQTDPQCIAIPVDDGLS